MHKCTKIVTNKIIDELNVEARESSRGRAHYFLHQSFSDPVQRFCNAMQTKAYVQPHKHCGLDRWELFVIVKGEAVALIFDDMGTVQEKILLGAMHGNYCVEIAPNFYHTIACLEDDTLLIEFKNGAYLPLSDKVFAPWSPEEGNINVSVYEEWFCKARIGESILDVIEKIT